MKKITLLMLSLAFTTMAAFAQIVKGDTNDDRIIDVDDINKLVNVILGQETKKYLDVIEVDNSLIAGKWYESRTLCYNFNEDGTTDYPGAVAYRAIPDSYCILLYNSEGRLSNVFRVVGGSYDLIELNPIGTTDTIVWTRTMPGIKVTDIMLNETHIDMVPGETFRLLALARPANATNTKVAWTVDNPDVALVDGEGYVHAVAPGTAVVTCKAMDGSGVKVECTVTVMNDHECVDLGLPSKTFWATCNVGAEKPEEFGKYYAWGETEGYAADESHYFGWSTYKFQGVNPYSGDKIFTKYTSNGFYADNKTVLDAEDDAATVNWGEGWLMPSAEQLRELFNTEYTTIETVTINDVRGTKITSKTNGNSIFLPIANFRIGESFGGGDMYGRYWSRELYNDGYCGSAVTVTIQPGEFHHGYDERGRGIPVRAVRLNKGLTLR